MRGGALVLRVLPRSATEKPFNHPDGTYTRRNGVYISGEETEFVVGDKTLRVKVDERYFLEGLSAIAADAGKFSEFQAHFAKYPLRIALHVAQIGSLATNIDSSRSNRPEIQFSTELLEQYWKVGEEKNDKDILSKDIIIIHELRHRVQEVLGGIVAARGSDAVEGGIGMTSVARSPLLDPKTDFTKVHWSRELTRVGIYLIQGFIAGLLLSPEEIDAHMQDGRLAKLPVFEKNRGKFFRFIEVKK